MLAVGADELRFAVADHAPRDEYRCGVAGAERLETVQVAAERGVMFEKKSSLSISTWGCSVIGSMFSST